MSGSPVRAGEPEATAHIQDRLRSIAEQARDGDTNAMRTLVKAVAPSVLQTSRKMLGFSHPEVDDVSQEALSAFVLALSRFRWQCTVTHFACRIAVRTALNCRRSERSRGVFDAELEPETLSDAELSPEEQLAVARRRQTIRSLLDSLPPDQAEAAALHWLLGYTTKEIAEVQTVPLNTVRNRLAAALEKLERCVKRFPDVYLGPVITQEPILAKKPTLLHAIRGAHE